MSAGLQGGGTLDFGATATAFDRVRQLTAGARYALALDPAGVQALFADCLLVEAVLGRLQAQGQWLTSRVNSLNSFHRAANN